MRSITVKMALFSVVLALSVPILAAGSGARAAERPRPPATHLGPRAPQTATVTVQPGDANALLQCLLGPGVQVSNAVLTAAPGATGTFSGALSVIGIDQGVILSSGSITGLIGPNLYDDFTTDNGLPGDASLDSLIPGYTTYDAAILEFDFSCQNPVAMSFQYVFSSEEYNEWVASPYNDVFGFFLNGVNIATVPATCNTPGIPVAINNVDCENPYNPPAGPNCDCYRNNDLQDGGGTINTEMDGLTQVFFATGQIQPGLNHMKIAIADAGDHILDSNVMIKCQSFSCVPAEETGACCFFGDDCFTLTQTECLSQGGYFLGYGYACRPNPCTEVESGVNGSNSGASGLPRQFALLGATPNPAGSATVIAFAVPSQVAVTLAIYDVTGRPVRTLAEGEEPAGTHSVSWDGTNASGQRMPAGVYFCRMTAGSFSRTLRIVVGR